MAHKLNWWPFQPAWSPALDYCDGNKSHSSDCVECVVGEHFNTDFWLGIILISRGFRPEMELSQGQAIG